MLVLFNNHLDVMEGWIYILSTKTHKLLKIGYTTDEPNVRASQLSDTSSPDPFIVEFALKMESPRTKESDVHLRLSRYRHTSNREFFNCKLDVAVQVVRDSAFGSKIISEQFSTNVEPSNEWLRKNENEQEARIIRQREHDDIKKQRKQQLENDINQRAKASAIDKERQTEKWSSSCIGLPYDQVFYPFKWSNASRFQIPSATVGCKPKAT